jgi:hypothetical protein
MDEGTVTFSNSMFQEVAYNMMVDSYRYNFFFEQRWAFGTFLVEEHDG